MGRQVGCDRRERPPAILDPAVGAVLLGQRAIERLVIQQGIARPGRPAEAAAPDEDFVGAVFEVFGLEVLCKAGRHRGTDAGADKDIEHRAALAKRLVDPDMRRAKAAAAGGDEPDGPAGQKPDQALDIDLIFERHMVMHEGRQPGEPGRGTADLAASPIVNAREATRRYGMNLAGKSFDISQCARGRIAAAGEHDHIGLSDRLARPHRCFAATEIDHQRRHMFELVEPLGDFGRVEFALRKHGAQACKVDDLGAGRGQPLAHSGIERRRQRLGSAVDQRHRSCPRRRAKRDQARGFLGEAPRQRRQQRFDDGARRAGRLPASTGSTNRSAET